MTARSLAFGALELASFMVGFWGTLYLVLSCAYLLASWMATS